MIVGIIFLICNLMLILTKIAEKSPASKPPCSRSESAGGG
ncbi:hypothetical protein JOC49_002509 [Fusibacter tunisiensis]|uniref:Cyclic lactone autoinducer peptide n=1 Tax=Fusibacter tunisiensis TaxID=1008308 RepID=A0ABS2MU43_9FIRM|nr:hypothetical protein [Fusibacter tunisiensis]